MRGRCIVKQRIEEKDNICKKKDNEQCAHYWIIEIANGPKSSGRCKYCGETREFYNAFPEFNPARSRGDLLGLPKLPRVKVKKESKS
jgi:hypothetical protein